MSRRKSSPEMTSWVQTKRIRKSMETNEESITVKVEEIQEDSGELEEAGFDAGQTIINAKLVALMTDISVKMKNLDDKIDLILENLLKLQRQEVSKKAESQENLDMLGILPVSDDDSFLELNDKISQESHLRHLLIKLLISVGGKDMRSHIQNMLRRVLSDEVAELYSLSGKSTLKNTIKKPFFATDVSKSIICACQSVYKDMATEVNVKEAVGDWLNQAKVRKTRRMQRKEKKYGEEFRITSVTSLKVEEDVEYFN